MGQWSPAVTMGEFIGTIFAVEPRISGGPSSEVGWTYC